MRSSHILYLQENSLGGSDYIIADIHGDDTSFQENLAKLTPADRLFVAGDLTDRGPDSTNVMRLILDYQREHPNQLFIVRGNHENACLKTISLLEDMIDIIDHIPYSEENGDDLQRWIDNIKNGKHASQEMRNFQNHLKDGGEWLVKLYIQEIFNGDITVYYPVVNSSESYDGSDSGSDDDEIDVIYQETSLIQAIREFMEALPYIIYVDGNNPFIIVHADMPFSDEILKLRIKAGADLTEEERSYATNARPPESQRAIVFNPAHRNADSIIAYCGHNIIAFGRTTVIRPQTNVVNTDVAACVTRVSLRVNHTKSTCEYVGLNVEASLQNYPSLVKIQSDLKQYLDAKAARQTNINAEQENINSLIVQDKAAFADDFEDDGFDDEEEKQPLSPSKRGNINSHKRERAEKDADMEKGPHTTMVTISPSKSKAALFQRPSGSPKKLRYDDESVVPSTKAALPVKKRL